jgi:malate synthase
MAGRPKTTRKAARKPARRSTSNQRKTSKKAKSTSILKKRAAKPAARKPARRAAAKRAVSRPVRSPAVAKRVAVPAGVKIVGEMLPAYSEILTAEAIAFLAGLERKFGGRRRELLERRAEMQKRLDRGEKPDFLPETAKIRDGDWTVAPLPKDLLDRRVEITGPTDHKMVINAMNCGASVFMPDFEDANTPTWHNMIDGQINLRDAIRRSITFDDPSSGKHYKLNDKTAVLIARPRGWHLPEKHVLVDGKPMSGSIFDFGLYFFHNAKELLERGSGPYFYLPKMESHLEARLWNDIFVEAQAKLGVPRGSIKATCLIETIMAAFEMDEFLYELREHSSGLNCGRWDYIYSFIKKFAEDPACVMPDRGQVTMTSHFLRSYSLALIKTCHRRNVHAMGGMAAQIPIKDDPVSNETAMAKVRADKEREAGDGHDGTWVAHPGLVPIAKEIFDRLMPEANQIKRKRQDVHVTASDLLQVPTGTITEAGLRQNINVGIGYIEAWLRGTGCVPLYNLMEDAATAEISRAQVWQQIRHKAKLAGDGRLIDVPLCRKIVGEELDKTKDMVGSERFKNGRYKEAAKVFRDLIEAKRFPEFLTLPAYDWIIAHE